MSRVIATRFQSFADASEGARGPERLARLRAALAARGLDALLVPRADEHQGEYVPASEERLAWLTGFTGSAGLAAVLGDRAALFVDGRYTAQAAAQVDAGAFEVVALAATTPEAWLAAALPRGARLGVDARRTTRGAVARARRAADKAGAEVVLLDDTPLDAIWDERPAPPAAPVALHPEALAGEGREAKLARARAALAQAGADALLLSDPHALAWTFNLRGGDVAHTPLALGHALVPREGRPALFLDPAKLSDAVRGPLAEAADLAGPGALDAALAAASAGGRRLRLDEATAGERLAALVETAGGVADLGPDPTALMRAVKSAAEIAGARAAHRRDGAALCRFLAWLDAAAPGGALTEIDAAVALEGFRAGTGALRDLSFPTIAGAGPNGALPHYRVTLATNRPLERGLFLIDSGAQYEDGTTDVTRTVAVGAPTPEERDRCTRVLRGHAAIARAVFPAGTSGAQIDAFARRPLWEAGLDFDHGTGHGVGSYLSVHEGPQRIAKTGAQALLPGMIVSNEPAYYAPGRYGVRLENLELVVERAVEGAERPMLGFEALTLAPFDRRLIEAAMLDAGERGWLDAYHARVLAAVGPLVDEGTHGWLEEACAPMG